MAPSPTFFDRVERRVETFAVSLALVGGAALIVATLVTCTSIVLGLIKDLADRLLGAAQVGQALPWLRPILGEEEIVGLAVGFAVFAALPFVMLRKGHITIDLFEPLYGGRLNRVFDFAGDVSLALLSYLILTRQWFQIFAPARGDADPLLSLLLAGDGGALWDRMRTSQETQVLGLPLWPTYAVAEFCVAAFFAVACFCVLRSGRRMFGMDTP